MPNSVDFGGRPFHFIGIGGIGMSALAHILTGRDIPVSGSDVRLTHITQRLQEAGAHIFWHQEAANLAYFGAAKGTAPSQLPQVICSTAIDMGNPEYRAAVEMGCPIFHRSDLLAALIADYDAIAVAGTHGKTTTSSMIGFLLLEGGLDPTIVVGGEVGAWKGNAHLGHGRYLVAEADESDGSLAKLSARFGIVTNIELDHTDHYQSLDDVINIFRTFESQCQTLVGCIDCATVRKTLSPQITYSLHPESEADYVATDIRYSAAGTVATIWERGQCLGRMRLSVLGQHNLSNALAAVAIGREVGMDFERIAEIMARFEGARRRFESRGCHGGVWFVDDYAHHPSEIRATLAAARLKLQDGSAEGAFQRVIAVFQPHRYSRTAALLADFADAFADADRVMITDIYSAGEANSFDISAEKLAEAMRTYHPQVAYAGTLPEMQQRLTEQLEAGDLVLFLGAGNLNQIIPEVAAFYADHEEQPLSRACS